MATSPGEDGVTTSAVGDHNHPPRRTIRQLATISPEEQEVLAVRSARNRARLRLQKAQQAEENVISGNRGTDSGHIADYDRASALLVEIAASSTKIQSIVRCLEGEETEIIINFLDKVLLHGITSDPHLLGRIIHLFSELAICARAVPTSFTVEGVDFGTVLIREASGPQVRKGEYKNRVVRVKGIPSTSEEDPLRSIEKKIIKEIITWAHLSHPNVAAFYGVSDRPLDFAGTRSLFSISPWAENLPDFLAAYPDTSRVPLISDIITGLEYIHSRGLVHGGLQGTNVLVSNTGRAAISDFSSSGRAGLSTAELGHTSSNLDAPELSELGARVTQASDIWSFGCICYETFTGTVGPYHAEPKVQLATVFLQSHIGPDSALLQGIIDNSALKRRVWGKMEKCWDRDPSQRPKATYLLLFFANLIGQDERPSAHSNHDPIAREAKCVRARTGVDYTRVYQILCSIQNRFSTGKSQETMYSLALASTNPVIQPIFFQSRAATPTALNESPEREYNPVNITGTVHAEASTAGIVPTQPQGMSSLHGTTKLLQGSGPQVLAKTRDTTRRVRFFGVEDSPPSYSSTLSSPGPQTPPQLYQPLVQVHQSSQSYTHAPALSPNNTALSIPCDLHGVLIMPTFDFDVSVDPATNPVMRDNLYVTKIRNEPATNPPVPSLVLTSRLLPWEVVISSSAFPFVTIADVLGGLYRTLRLPASEEEYLRLSPEKRDAVSLAYYQRHERVSNVELREREKQKGVKRIDFLAGAHRFRGLSKTERPNVWNMKFKS